jgi:RND family efflux transporter MFP subunit
MSRSLVLLCSLALSACGGEVPPAPTGPRPVRAMRIGSPAEMIQRSFPGRAEATQEVDLAFEVTGQLIERPIRVGDEVVAGQLLAALDPRDFENDAQAARAQREQAVAYRERIEQAAASGAVAQQEVTDAVARYDISVANLSIKEKALDDSRIVAPFDGRVAATYVENFQNVRPKQRVVRLLDVSRIEMVISIPEQFIQYASQIRDIHCHFDAFPDVEVPARIIEVGTEASETTRTYPVTLEMEQPAGLEILPGMTGEATGDRIEESATTGEGVAVVAVSAVFEGADGASYVWSIDEGNMTVARRPVDVGALTSFGLEVSGIGEGQWIATAGVHYLEAGQQVRILEPGESR